MTHMPSDLNLEPQIENLVVTPFDFEVPCADLLCCVFWRILAVRLATADVKTASMSESNDTSLAFLQKATGFKNPIWRCCCLALKAKLVVWFQDTEVSTWRVTGT